MPNSEFQNPYSELLLSLPWPGRLWKPKYGEVEQSLKRTLRLRIALSVATFIGLWSLAVFQVLQGHNDRNWISAAAVFSIFVPLILHAVYPRQLKREVKLPFHVDIGSQGITFKLARKSFFTWDIISGYAFCPSDNPDLNRLEILVWDNNDQCGLAFPYDPEEIDENLLKSILAQYLPNKERQSICSMNYTSCNCSNKN